MEDNFYLDDFELSLKEQANQFKMIPSKKVWHGIYNDMHPGRRWPSVTISLLLVVSILFVGYVNTHSDKKLKESIQTSANKDKPNESQGRPLVNKSPIAEKLTSHKNVSAAKPIKEIATISFINDKNLSGISPDEKNITSQKNSAVADITTLGNTKNAISPIVLQNANIYPVNQVSNFLETGANKKINRTENATQIKNNYSNNILISKEPKTFITEKQIDKSINSEITIPGNIALENNTSHNSTSINKVDGTNAESSISISSVPSKNSISKFHKKKNNKITWVYYGGISVNTVAFNGNHLEVNNNQNSLSLPQVTQKDIRIIRNAALGYEAGIQMNYLFAKKLQLTAGVHFTRSGYNIISNEVHPTLTTLLLKDKSTGNIYPRSFVTHYGDGTGQSNTTLHNYSYQASIPIGLQYELWGNNKIQLNLSTNIEPSLVVKSNAYIVSSDGKHYVNLPDLSRKLNFGTNFSPFISFKSDKFKWNIGPNIRYQWLSSYTVDYTLKEHLIDYGIRVGISK